MSENVDAYKGKWLKMLMQIGKMAENVDACVWKCWCSYNNYHLHNKIIYKYKYTLLYSIKTFI